MRAQIIAKAHLVISIIVVVPAALMYGFSPDTLVELTPNTTDEQSFFKAVMGLYLGFSVLWTLGLFKRSVLKTALISNTLFMLGLGFGRLLSFAIDGIPTMLYVYGAFAELFLGFYGLWFLSVRYQRFTKKH